MIHFASEMCDKGMLPVNVLDGSGEMIRRAIVSCNDETGEVVSQVLDKNGNHQLTDDDKLLTRSEIYPLPITFVKINKEEVAAHKRQYRDLE